MDCQQNRRKCSFFAVCPHGDDNDGLHGPHSKTEISKTCSRILHQSSHVSRWDPLVHACEYLRTELLSVVAASDWQTTCRRDDVGRLCDRVECTCCTWWTPTRRAGHSSSTACCSASPSCLHTVTTLTSFCAIELCRVNNRTKGNTFCQKRSHKCQEMPTFERGVSCRRWKVL